MMKREATKQSQETDSSQCETVIRSHLLYDSFSSLQMGYKKD
jgi:hypothetical protein